MDPFLDVRGAGHSHLAIARDNYNIIPNGDLAAEPEPLEFDTVTPLPSVKGVW
jgi:hypothetical protein